MAIYMEAYNQTLLRIFAAIGIHPPFSLAIFGLLCLIAAIVIARFFGLNSSRWVFVGIFGTLSLFALSAFVGYGVQGVSGPYRFFADGVVICLTLYAAFLPLALVRAAKVEKRQLL